MSFTDKLKTRIGKYLKENQSKQYIDIDDMSKNLYKRYPEYGRQKLKVFHASVDKAFNELVEAANNPKPDASKDKSKDKEKEKEKSTDKKTTSSTPTPSSSSSSAHKRKMADRVLSSSSSSDDDIRTVTAVKGKGSSVNNTITDLYASKTPAKSSSEVSKKSKIAHTTGTDSPKCVSKENSSEPDIQEIPLEKRPSPEVIDVDNDNNDAKAAKSSTQTPKQGDSTKSSPATASKTSKTVPDSDKKIASKTSTNGSAPATKKKRVDITAKESQVKIADVAGIDNILMELASELLIVTTGSKCKNSTMLLHGPPGCGKTLLARAIAGEMEWPLIEVTSPELVSGISGETEQQLRKLFEAAEAASPCVLFIDEIDAIAQRKDGSSQGRGMENRILAQLRSSLSNLQSMTEQKILFLAATNFPESLEVTLRSHFQKEIAIGIPNEKAREQILKLMLADSNLAEDFDYTRLARNTPSYVGRDFNYLIIQAERLAWNRRIDDHLEANGTKKSVQNLFELVRNRDKVGFDKEPPKIGMVDFDDALKTIQPAAKREGFASVPDVTWNDIGALDHVRQTIDLGVLARINNPDEAIAFNLENPTGVVLCGPPGCGKTLVAKAVANEAGINFISVKGPELLNMV